MMKAALSSTPDSGPGRCRPGESGAERRAAMWMIIAPSLVNYPCLISLSGDCTDSVFISIEQAVVF